MNNKFWREIFDQIASMVMIFRFQKDQAELMFVNKAVNMSLGYTPEAFVLESEQDGDLKTTLNHLVNESIKGGQHAVLNDLSGAQLSFEVELKTFFSDAIKEDLAILTLHPHHQGHAGEATDSSLVAESIVMKSVLERIRQLEETGACMAFVGSAGTGKRLMMDRILRSTAGAGISVWKLDYADPKRPQLAMDGVKVDLQNLCSSKLRKITSIFLYEMDRMPKADQTLLSAFVKDQESMIRFVCGSKESPDALMSSGRLLPELYYKLNTISVVLPSLDMRRSDIRPYAERWLRSVCDATSMDYPTIPDREWTRVFHHEYKNNYDELNEILKRSLLGSSGEAFQFSFESHGGSTRANRAVAAHRESTIQLDPDASHEDHMRDYLQQVMIRNGWKIYGGDGAASKLGLKPTTLQSKLEKYGVRKN